MTKRIEKFSKEVSKELKYYVYRLIDPRNGQTFYVGKGKGNRVFAHAKDRLDNYEGEDYRDKVEDSEDRLDADEQSEKIKTIREIIRANLEVMYVIHRWGLEEGEAFEVEAAVMDAFPGLTNIQSGHNAERGACSVMELEEMFHCETYDEPEDYKYMIIKVREWRIEEMEEIFGLESARYEATRRSWRIRTPDPKEYPYVLSVTNGIVEEIYEVDRWENSEEIKGRKEFTGKKADDKISNHFKGKRIPDKYAKKGMASPVLYSKNM